MKKARPSPHLVLRRVARLPDPVRVARYQRAPELGPKLLFFSGGTALRPLCRVLKRYTHNSIHLITPFDSGGSSSRLRSTFGMLSVGDLRNRLLALADETVQGNPATYSLLSHRFPPYGDPADLRRRLDALLSGEDPLVQAVPAPLRRLFRTGLRQFADRAPDDFDLCEASVGNLFLAGVYLENDRDLDSALFLFSRLVKCRGVVRASAEVDAQITAVLEDGQRLVGQHRISRPEPPALAHPSPISSLAIDPLHGPVRAPERVADLVGKAELICYPMGSFHTSLLASLLPAGLGAAIAAAGCPKVYVPNTGHDPEQAEMTLSAAVARLLATLRADAGADTPVGDLLHAVILDSDGRHDAAEIEAVRALGVEVARTRLSTEASRPLLAPDRLTETLLSLV